MACDPSHLPPARLAEPVHLRLGAPFPICSCPSLARFGIRIQRYPLVIKHGNGKSSINGGFNRKMTEKWFLFHCHVWLPEGSLSFRKSCLKMGQLPNLKEFGPAWCEHPSKLKDSICQAALIVTKLLHDFVQNLCSSCTEAASSPATYICFNVSMIARVACWMV